MLDRVPNLPAQSCPGFPGSGRRPAVLLSIRRRSEERRRTWQLKARVLLAVDPPSFRHRLDRGGAMARGLPQCDESWPFGSGWRDGEDAGGSGTREGRTRGEGTGWERTRSIVRLFSLAGAYFDA